MNRMQPPDGPHAPSAHPVYESSWRPSYHPPPYDSHPEARRLSAPTQGPLPPQTYPGPPPVIPNRDLPLPPDGPYGRPNSLPGPSHPPPEPSPVHTSFRPPLNGSPHEASPQSATPDYRPRMPYPPSEAAVSNEGTPPISGHLPPTSQYMQAPPIPAGATPISYDAYFNQAPGARQRKANRATQACDQCRARKAKCDEGRPSCSHCKENNLGCVYKEVPHHKQEKGTQVVIDKMENLQDTNINYFDKIVGLARGADNQLAQLSRVPEQLATLIQMLAPMLPANQGLAALQSLETPTLKVEPQSMKMQPDTPDAAAGYSQHSTASATMPAEIDENMKKDETEGELSIPVEHTTAAHKLLMWPSIKMLMAPHEYDEDYVMRLEEERGLISVRGQGENSFSADGTRLSTYVNGLNGSFSSEKSYPPENDHYTPKEEPLSEEEFLPEITNTGLLHLDAATAQTYCQVFLDRMHRLHPFMDYTEIQTQLNEFISFYCPRSSTPYSNTLCQENHAGAKRKRSYDEPQGIRGAPVDPNSANPRIRVGMNIENARMLLILALGAICQCPDPLPGPIVDTNIDYLLQYIPPPLPPIPPEASLVNNNTTGVLSPPNSDTALPTTVPMYNPATQSYPPVPGAPVPVAPIPGATLTPKNLSRRSISKVRNEYGHVKNLQIIPGLALYGYATAILGHLQGGVELEHVQAGLLAGLYAGQLAHPFQSHGWICQAARACQVLVRQRRYERIEEGPVKDMFNFAYWTCLQLESDLLAELDIPASGISRSEGRIGLPKGRYTIDLPDTFTAMNTRMMLFYSAQIHLRKVLNRVHTDLYKVEKPTPKELAEKNPRWSSNVQIALSMNLDLWRDSLPDIMKWKDSDPPAKEINAARMRAKYYGARYIIHRPLLYHALHFGHEGVSKVKNGTTVDSPNNVTKSQQMSPLVNQSSARASNMSRMTSDMGSTPIATKYPDFPNGWTPPTTSLRDMPSKLRHACKVCVESAIQSTTAFDGIEDRLVVTNIFGTAHAQFGNMLVLSATYMSSISELVERSTLERLLRRTIKFLLRSKNISPTLRADARILTEIYTKIFGPNSLTVRPLTPLT